MLGAGISGLMHIALARSLGAGLVIAADTIPFRLKKAKEMGAHLALEAGGYLVEELKAANQGMKADVVIIGFEGFIPLALDCVERGGTVLFFAGAAEGATIAKPINDIFWRTEVTLTSSYAGAPADCAQALKLIAGGAVPVEKMITHRLSLAEAQSGFSAVASPMEHDSLKVVILPHG
jgi:L-iditol 2-dehydrogenase